MESAVLTALATVLPIFAVIAIGFGCGRIGILGVAASAELNRFVISLALPALLFEVMANVKWSVLWEPDFIVAFTFGTFGIFTLVLGMEAWKGRPKPDAAIAGLNAAYANTGFIGFPLCEAIFGKESLPVVTISVIITVCILFTVAHVIIQTGKEVEAAAAGTWTERVSRLLGSPLLLAPFAGFLLSAMEAKLPSPMESVIQMIAGSATPCALVGLGLFLATTRPQHSTCGAAPLAYSALKLIGQPLLTVAVAIGIFDMSRKAAALVTILAALPTGTGPFMLATNYDRKALVTAQTVLLTTVTSVLTLAALIALFGL
jgi:predicted permease